MSDVVVGFEKGSRVARWAWSHNNGTSFTMAHGSAWQLPTDLPSDNETQFRTYEGSPVPVSFHQAQLPVMPNGRRFVMVTMAGTDSHGLSRNNSTYSTDIYGLVSIDGGETFHAPVRLNSKVGGPNDPTYTHGAITFVTAVPEFDNGFATGNVLVFWRQEKYLRNPTCPTPGCAVVAQWWRRTVQTQQNISQPNVVNPLFLYDADPFLADQIPSSVDEISVVSNAPHVYVAYASYASGATPNTKFTCPSTATVGVAWRVRDISYSSTYASAFPASDTAWRRCVGASSVAGGTSFNRAVSRPGLAVNPVTGRLYVAISRKAMLSDTHSRVEVFSTSASGAPQEWLWNSVYSSPRVYASSGTVIPRDAWMPVIAAHQYPGETDGYLALNYVTTRYDTTGNNRVRQAGWTWQVGNPQPVEALVDGGSNSGSFPVEDRMGSFNGLVALPRYDGGFLSAWGDHRDTMTRVWTARMHESF
jgi:hypothetical protein